MTLVEYYLALRKLNVSAVDAYRTAKFAYSIGIPPALAKFKFC